jgi:hypothetical protein
MTLFRMVVAAAVVDIDAGAVAGQNIVADQRAGN